MQCISLDPKKTIPPYEDQNNRRPPKDLTLRLNPKALDKQLKDWEKITKSLADNYILKTRVLSKILCSVSANICLDLVSPFCGRALSSKPSLISIFSVMWIFIDGKI
jgi:hypothetical protein